VPIPTTGSSRSAPGVFAVINALLAAVWARAHFDTEAGVVLAIA
jgi:hypothetical protein